MWPFKKKETDRTYDFEAHCSKCHEPLDMYLQVVRHDIVILRPTACLQHPGKELILWPQRNDIIRLPSEPPVVPSSPPSPSPEAEPYEED